VIVHSNTHIAKQLFMKWFLPSSSKDSGHGIKYTNHMMYYHIISVKPTAVVKSSWWLLIITLPPALRNSRHSGKQNKKKIFLKLHNYSTQICNYPRDTVCSIFGKYPFWLTNWNSHFLGDTAFSSLQPFPNPSMPCIHTNIQVSCQALLVSQHWTINMKTSLIY